MENSPTSSTSIVSHDKTGNEDSLELTNLNMSLTNDSILQGLNESRSELLSNVQNIKKDLQNWREKLDIEVNSNNDDVGGLKKLLNSNVEKLTDEFQELKKTLKEQLAVTTSKLIELDTSIIDCAQYLEELNTNCELEKSLFDDLITDLGLKNHDKGGKRTTTDSSNSKALLSN